MSHKSALILLLTINMKPYSESPMVASHLTFSEGQSRSLKISFLISCNICKGADLGHLLLLNINRKPYMGSLMTPSDLTLSDLERSKSRSHFE